MGEQYILQWHYHESTLCKNLPFLFDSDILTDCSIAAGNKTFKAHKLILATCSPYFLQLFQINSIEPSYVAPWCGALLGSHLLDVTLTSTKRTIKTQVKDTYGISNFWLSKDNTGPIELPVLILHDSKAEDMEAILSYIYRGQCLVTKEQLPGLISLAKTLKIQGLCSMKTDEADVIDPNNYRSEGFLSTYVPEELIYNLNSSKCNESYKNKDTIITEEQTKQKTFPKIMDLHKKRNVKDAQEICKCFVCGKYLSNQYNLRVHMETHKQTYYSCRSCPHVSKSRDALRKHISYRHPENYTSRKKRKYDSACDN